MSIKGVVVGELGRCYHPSVIIDFHTHIFPPEVRDRRDEYLRRDATFAEMYASPRAAIATAEDLLGSMEAAGVDVSVALGFGWGEHDLCRRHNDYLLRQAARSGGRLIPFCIVNPLAGGRAAAEVARCAAGGARGLGELRPANQGYDLAQSEAGRRLAQLAAEHDLILLFHVTEPAGHGYPGKQGLPLSRFRRFVAANPGLKVVGAHLGGGLPLQARNRAEGLSNTYVDTAATPFLYDVSVIPSAAAAMGGRLLLGSDFPLIGQRRQIDLIQSAVDADTAAEILGAAAARLLGL